MIRIDGPQGLRGAAPRRKPGSGPGGAFADALDCAAAADTAPRGSAAAAGLSSLDALLALQSVDDATVGRRRARARAEGLLDLLEDLRRCLLLGSVPRARLERLAALVRAREACPDPRLAEVLAEIELRVEVELAKLEPTR